MNGNLTKVSGDKTLAKQNPFRYRSYYYDEELGLYYLQSRYYDSQLNGNLCIKIFLKLLTLAHFDVKIYQCAAQRG